ncbi:biotin transporter BioY [Prochlorococcus sp. MIT 1307]|uniref:biotin transporter BioY n=1 Tax=Prochlorococcus sp. MIT 1307 TaxID=3096219 RepID=UPI002A74F82B|nr:biotin transporter BioY [Prochlorococcus sp. MIT 1307]
MRALAIWSGALAALMMMMVGGFTPTALILPGLDFTPKAVPLASTFQVPALLLSALVFGPRAAVIATLAYLVIGLFYMPIFHEGGSLNYLASPGFGYLTGFIPAAWISGRLLQQSKSIDLITLALCALAGIIILQIWGGLYLIIGSAIGSWQETLPELLFSYSIAPLPSQILLCPAIGVLSIALRGLLFIA